MINFHVSYVTELEFELPGLLDMHSDGYRLHYGPGRKQKNGETDKIQVGCNNRKNKGLGTNNNETLRHKYIIRKRKGLATNNNKTLMHSYNERQKNCNRIAPSEVRLTIVETITVTKISCVKYHIRSTR